MLFKNKKIIGLDIGTTTIKMAELEVGRRSTSLVSFGMTPTPAGSINNGDIVNAGAISSAIRQLTDEMGSKRKNVAAGMWGASVIVKKISIPRIEESMISEQIRWEAEQYIPFDIDDVNLEYEILKSGSGDNMDLLLVAAKQQQVLNFVESVEGAELSCQVLDVEGFALANCFENNYGKVSNQVIGLLNIGAQVTNFVIVSEGDVVFCRDIPVGGNTYTSDLQRSLGVDADEAENLKLSYVSGQPTPDEVKACLNSTSELVCDEIAGSLEFFINTTSNRPLDKLMVTGGSCRIPGLLEQMKIQTGVESESFNPFKSIGFNKRVFSKDYIAQISHYAPVVMGLALRAVSD